MKTPNCRILASSLVVAALLLDASVLQPAQAGIWVGNSPMTIARFDHTATLLTNGMVLVAGGIGLSSAELYGPATGTWTATGSMAANRAMHTATLLPNGKVLVAGGLTSQGIYNHSNNGAELYDPIMGTWMVTGAMAAARYSHTATLLPNGKVLVAGGNDLSSYLSRTELYDPDTETWTTTGSMTSPRDGHTATLLTNGKVLVAGGFGLSSAELYDPATGTWTATGSMTCERSEHTATLLPNGKVLVAGGINSSGNSALSSAEVYDPGTSTWTPVGAMSTGRYGHTATLLSNGKVLIAGGGIVSAIAFTNSTELYQPSTSTWVAGGVMTAARVEQTATLLPDGSLLVAGGRNRIGNNVGPVSSTDLYVKNAATVTLGKLVQTYDGAAKSVFVTTAPPGLAVNVTYNGLTNAPINAGSYTVVGTINDPDYQGGATKILLVVKAPAIVTLGNLTRTYTGGAINITASTSPPGLTVNLTYNGSSTPPTNAGSYTVIGTINDPNYQGSATNTLVVGKATGTAILVNLVQTYDGAAKNVSVSTAPPGLAVNVTYSGSTSAPINAGRYIVIGTIDDPNYQAIVTNTLVVGKAAGTVILADLVQTYNGTGKSVTVTTAPPGLTVEVTYNGSANTPTNADSYTVIGTIDDSDYQGNATNMLVISKAATTTMLTNVTEGYFFPGQSLTAAYLVSLVTPGTATPTGTVTLTNEMFTVSGPAPTGTLTMLLTNVGSYHFAATYSGDSNFLPSCSSPPVSRTVLSMTNSAARFAGLVISNGTRFLQTSLMQQLLTLTNVTSQTLAAVRVTIHLSAADQAKHIVVYNASGTNGAGEPFLQYNYPLPPGGSLTLTVEYYSPDRVTVPNSTFTVELVTPETLVAPPGTPQAVLRPPVVLPPDNALLIDFATVAGATYYVLYKDDLASTNWNVAQPPVMGAGYDMQWVDDGPPKTESPPSSVPQRYYEVLKAN